eukprot:3928315-Alexandrium_andersonii.AAC.1
MPAKLLQYSSMPAPCYCAHGFTVEPRHCGAIPHAACSCPVPVVASSSWRHVSSLWVAPDGGSVQT